MWPDCEPLGPLSEEGQASSPSRPVRRLSRSSPGGGPAVHRRHCQSSPPGTHNMLTGVDASYDVVCLHTPMLLLVDDRQ